MTSLSFDNAMSKARDNEERAESYQRNGDYNSAANCYRDAAREYENASFIAYGYGNFSISSGINNCADRCMNMVSEMRYKVLEESEKKLNRKNDEFIM